MPFTKRVSPSVTPVPTTEAGDGSALPSEQWKGMQDILNHVYDYRLADAYDPSKVFHRKVNKRAIPAYYEVIKEPIALSTVKAKINTKAYKTFAEFVRDFALISHNAQVYNRPTAGVYQDALIIRAQLEEQLQKLVDQKVIQAEDTTIPYLGEIPAQDEIIAEEEEEEDDDDEEDEDDEGGEESEEEGVKRRKRGRPKGSVAKRDKGDTDKQADDPDNRKKRGRPPKVNTPMEARIQAVLKGIRKPKNSFGQMKISHFERVPDKAAMPEYFNEIKTPMAFDMLKRKLKRKKYQSFEQFMKDVDIMFENAKQYNQDESQIFKDAVELQVEANRLANEERSKPDTEFVMEEGRIPMPNGILHNGELYKVGDWVLIQNANDLTKPIPTQIYRTWQDAEGGRWVNVVWYYRPEQTVHRFDKHFLDSEIVKTGQYRDHRIDEIIGRCFIMFFTRYFKGRPRNLPADMEIFVCEARYNEEKLTFNKIKTWASCLPDEVRDQDYEMDLFEGVRKMKKFPSPIAYLLKDEQKETDDMPKPEWGAENAPPKIGAVHRRARDPKDSPPPERTPTPPPVQPTPAPMPRTTSHMSPNNGAPSYSPMMGTTNNNTQMAAPSPARPQTTTRPSFTPSHPGQYVQPSPSPAPLQRAMSAQRSAFPPATPQHIQAPTLPRPAIPQTGYPNAPISAAPLLPPDRPASSYRGPPPIEVYTLPDNANSSIPAEIRTQFQRDEHGRILFFTTPPVHISDDHLTANDAAAGKAALGHSIKYMASKIRSKEEISVKRKAHEEAKAEAQAEKKKRRVKDEARAQTELSNLKNRAVQTLEEELSYSVGRDLVALYGDAWEEYLDDDLKRLGGAQRETIARHKAIDENEKLRAVKYRVPLGSAGTLLDDVEA